MARGVSTVLDVAVCLLVVGAAVATLASIPPAGGDDALDADATARLLATGTVAVPADDGTGHATYGAHLARGAVSAATVEDRRLLETPYPAAVRRETANATGDRTFVTARWEPYPDAVVGGRIAAGRRPPESADVAATTLTVDSGIAPPDADAAGSFKTLGRALAAAYVEWAFPPERTRAALVDPRIAESTAARYWIAADAVGADVDEPVAEADVEAANAALAEALAKRLAADLQEHYRTSEAAATDVTVDEVTVVVRRWEP